MPMAFKRFQEVETSLVLKFILIEGIDYCNVKHDSVYNVRLQNLLCALCFEFAQHFYSHF